jgi:hypothetical protein
LKPTFTIGILGGHPNQQTSLLVALDKSSNSVAKTTTLTLQEEPQLNLVVTEMTCESDARSYQFVHCPNPLSWDLRLLANGFSSCSALDCLLVLLNPQRVSASLQNLLQTACQLGAFSPVVFLQNINEKEVLLDEQELDQVELNTRKQLDDCGYPGNEVLFFRGNVLTSDEEFVQDFLEALDDYLPEHTPLENSTSSIVVHRVVPSRKDVVIAAKTYGNKPKPGERLQLLDGPSTLVSVSPENKDELYTISGATPEDLPPGQMILGLGEPLYEKFRAEIYMEKAISNGEYYFKFFSIVTNRGSLRLLRGKGYSTSCTSASVDLFAQLPLSVGQFFTVHQQSERVGLGCITSVQPGEHNKRPTFTVVYDLLAAFVEIYNRSGRLDLCIKQLFPSPERLHQAIENFWENVKKDVHAGIIPSVDTYPDQIFSERQDYLRKIIFGKRRYYELLRVNYRPKGLLKKNTRDRNYKIKEDIELCDVTLRLRAIGSTYEPQVVLPLGRFSNGAWYLFDL